jgi:membrane-associated phospholipid phosphatase
MRTPALVLSTLAVALTACADPPTGPATDVAARRSSAADSPHGGAAVHWNGVARGLVAKYGANAFQAIRGYALLSVAQYNALMAAERGTTGSIHAYERAAVAGASVVVLGYLFPAEASALEAMADGLLVAPGHPAARPSDDATGEAIGRAAAELIVARARTDRFSAPWTGTVPTGPGLWFSSAVPPAAPAGPLLGQMKPFLLASGGQFRPPPPPAHGSPEFAAALAEVRAIADARTPEQDRIAKFWAFPAGTYQPPGYWNEEAATLAVRYRLGERRTAHVLALMNMVGMDALIATHDAKFVYWLIRPSQADPMIRLAVGLPNFPSYPSNHATLSSGMAAILAAAFPAEAGRLDALAAEAALSRLLGGIHYRFDNETGLRLGRTIAAWALEHDVVGHRPFELAP